MRPKPILLLELGQRTAEYKKLHKSWRAERRLIEKALAQDGQTQQRHLSQQSPLKTPSAE